MRQLADALEFCQEMEKVLRAEKMQRETEKMLGKAAPSPVTNVLCSFRPTLGSQHREYCIRGLLPAFAAAAGNEFPGVSELPVVSNVLQHTPRSTCSE